MKTSEQLSPEEELRLAFARMAGLVIAAIVLTLGGGIVLIVLTAVVFRFLYSG